MQSTPPPSGFSELTLTPTHSAAPASFTSDNAWLARSSSLLLSLSMLPLRDLVCAACVCRDWYSLVTRDSQQLAWRWQKHEERRKFRLQQRKQSVAPSEMRAAAAASASAVAASSSSATVTAVPSLAFSEAEELPSLFLPFGPHSPSVMLCRHAMLRATTRAYFLREGFGLLAPAQQAQESPIYESDAGLLRPLFVWPPASSASSGSNLPRSTPLLFHLRSLSLVMHSQLTVVWGRFLAALPHLTRLELTITSMWGVDPPALMEAFQALGSKRQPLLSLQLAFVDLEAAAIIQQQQRQRAGSAAASSSAVAAASSAPPESSPSIVASYLALTAVLPLLSGLRSLSLQGVTGCMDASCHLSFLLRADPASDQAGSLYVPSFPHLLHLSLPAELPKTAHRIYSVRQALQSSGQASLEWGSWANLMDLTLMLSTAAAEQRRERREEERKREEEGGAIERRSSVASGGSSYIPLPLRLPVISLVSLSLEGGALSSRHLEVVCLLAPTLRLLVVQDCSPWPKAIQDWSALRPFTRGRIPEEDEDAEADVQPREDEEARARLIPARGVEDLSLSCNRWSHVSLTTLQALGAWPRLRRLVLASSSIDETDSSGSPHHSLSIANSNYHPASLFSTAFGVGRGLVELEIHGLPVTGLGCIAHAGFAASSVLRKLVLRRVLSFNSPSLSSLLHLRRSLRHLVLDEVQAVGVEELERLLPPVSVAAAAAVTMSASSALTPLVAAPSAPPALHLLSFSYSPLHVVSHHAGNSAAALGSVRGSYTSMLREWSRLHPRQRHPMQQEPFSTAEDRAVLLEQQPSAATVNRWTEAGLHSWRVRMDAAAAADSSLLCGPSPPLQVHFRPLPVSGLSPQWQLSE